MKQLKMRTGSELSREAKLMSSSPKVSAQITSMETCLTFRGMEMKWKVAQECKDVSVGAGVWQVHSRQREMEMIVNVI